MKKRIGDVKQGKRLFKLLKRADPKIFLLLILFVALAIAILPIPLANAQSDEDVIIENGKISIGSSTPTEKLVVLGNVEAVKDNEVYINLKNTETNGRQYALISAGSSGGIGVGKFSIYDNTAGVSRLTINEDGNIGFGTRNPAEKLVVIGNVNISGTLNVSGRVSFPNIAGQNCLGTDADGVLQAGSCTGPGAAIGGYGRAGYVPLWNNTDQINESAIYQNEYGNIGVGTATPAVKLDITGGYLRAQEMSDFSASNSGTQSISITGTTTLTYSVTGSNGWLTGSSDRITISASASPATYLIFAKMKLTGNCLKQLVIGKNGDTLLTQQSGYSGANWVMSATAIDTGSANDYYYAYASHTCTASQTASEVVLRAVQIH